MPPPIALLLHDQFDFGALGAQNWSLSEMKRLLRWYKDLGWNRVVFLAWPVHNNHADGFNVLELTALYGSGIRPRTGFRPGNFYDPDDRYLGSETGLARAERIKTLMSYARGIGLSPWIQFNTTHGSPQFCEEHPELIAIDTFDFTAEGLSLCTSKPPALEHIIARHARMLRFLDCVDGVYLTFRDGGGCNCALCQPQQKVMAKLATEFFQLIRGIHPRVPVVFVSHHVHHTEVPDLAKSIPAEMWVAEAMRTQSLDVPLEEDVKRVKTWQAEGRHVEGAMAIQENPTALLPSVYPNRIERAVALSHNLGVKGLYVGSTLNPYVFPMHWWLLPRLWRREASVHDLVKRYFEQSFGPASVEPGMKWATAMEGALDLAQSQSQRDSGFQKMLVINFAARMLPEKCIRDGVPDAFRHDMTEAVRLAREACDAAERLGDSAREFHAMDANAIVAGTEVLTHYFAMRLAKGPVLDALHDGDPPRAVKAFAAVEHACREMVACCRNSPNTDMLARQWRRLETLPERLASLKRLLPELAERKRLRPILLPLEMAEQSWMQKKPAH